MADTVYCNQCKYYKKCKKSTHCIHTFDCGDIHEQCNAPQNIRQVHNTSQSNKYISCPSIINRFNNCKWFVNKDTEPFPPTPSTSESYITDLPCINLGN